MPRAKKAKPSFDLAPVDPGPGQVGWVYRSDAPLLPPPSPSPEPPPPDAPAPRPSFTTTPLTPPASRSWLEAGASVAVLPLSIALVALLVPAFWLLAPRTRS